jgi:signal transduction histidine kinase/CheY-like chemotaxis protein
MVWESALFSLPDDPWSGRLEDDMDACDDPIWIFDVARSAVPWANTRGLEFWNAPSIEDLARRDFAVGMSPATRRRLSAYQRILLRGESVADRWTLFPAGRPQSMVLLVARVPSDAGVDRLLFRGRHCETSQADIRGVEALRHTSVMISLCSPRGRVLMQNPAAAEAYRDLVTNVSPDALRRRFASSADADLVERSLEESGEFEGELRVQTADGEVWHAVHALRTSDPATGRPAILVDETNIDAKKRSELALAAAREDLELRVAARTRDVARQGAFVEAILDTSPNLMFVADAAGVLVRTNHALRQWRRCDGDEGSAMAWDLLGDCDERTFRAWVERGPPPDFEVEHTADTGERTTLYWAIQVFAVDGETFVVGSGLDITERREMQLRVQTNDRMVALGTLASGVAHEINNPLAYVLTNVELAQSQAREGDVEGVTRHLAEASEACVRAAKIVADLKGFSQSPGSTTAVNLRAVVDSSRRMMSHLLVDRRVFRCSVASDVWVRADETKLCQVVLNLLLNAAEACVGAGAEAVIDVSSNLHAQSVVLRVEDTGVGMPEPVVSRIFDPFFSTKGPRQGTGLGLSISHRIVQQLGGSIEVESREGLGSTFLVELPIAASPGDEPAVAESTHRKERARVLIVDDEPGLAEAFGMSLPRHDTSIATSGVEALAALDAGVFDVIVCDMSMPEMDGPQLHEALQQSDPDMAARMVFVTGGAFTTEAHEFLRDRADVTLYKPASAKALAELVEAVFDRLGPRGG